MIRESIVWNFSEIYSIVFSTLLKNVFMKTNEEYWETRSESRLKINCEHAMIHCLFGSIKFQSMSKTIDMERSCSDEADWVDCHILRNTGKRTSMGIKLESFSSLEGIDINRWWWRLFIELPLKFRHGLWAHSVGEALYVVGHTNLFFFLRLPPCQGQ